MLNNYFLNFESIKLYISSPDLNNFFIIAIFFFLSIVSVKRIKPTKLLYVSQTNQLKGIAIILVLLGHLWVHVSQNSPSIIFSSDSVYLFLFLSGYGLTVSSENHILLFKDFAKRRISKVMIPYWTTTIIILLLDFFFLNKIYSNNNLILTFTGINITQSTQYIDYVRWYITFQLFCYLLFFIFNKYFSFLKTAAILILYLIISVIFSQITGIANRYELAFPLGLFIGKIHHKAENIFERKTKICIFTGIILFILLIFYKIFNLFDFLKNIEASTIIIKTILFVAIKGIANLFYISFSFLFIVIIGLIGKYGYLSKFLHFCGTISYELFLLHGCFLIKYNFIFPLFDTKLISVAFFIYFFIILIIAFYFNKMLNKLPG
jgi:peptidoglycan/LPS O-acetylase OafA/YrhL